MALDDRPGEQGAHQNAGQDGPGDLARGAKAAHDRTPAKAEMVSNGVAATRENA
jgi:hypothetical protein